MTWENAASQPLLTVQFIADQHRNATAYTGDSQVSLHFGRLFDGLITIDDNRIVLNAKNDVTLADDPRPRTGQGSYQNQTDKTTEETPPGDDQETVDPRIAYWCEKVNQHRENSEWQTDPDGTSGCQEDKLTYCQEFYPETTRVEPAGKHRITGWRSAGNTGSTTATKQTYRCVQPTT
jgi:hypothetical protein